MWLARYTRPSLSVTLGLLLFAAVWLAHLSSTSLSPPTDNIEQLNWVHSLEWGYYKHPPLPTWLLWGPVQLFGLSAWTSYATGTALNLAVMGVLWRLMSRLRGIRFATLALLAVLCVTYYSAGLYAYNHNTLLTFWSTACAALCWQAYNSARLRWWALLGLALGLGMVTKYQIVVTMTSVFVFWLTQRGWRDARQRTGLLLAALLALLVFVPHLQWLRTHNFGPVGYAIESSLGAQLTAAERVSDVLNWLADQLLNRAAAAWLMLAAVLYLSKGAAPLERGAGSPSRSGHGDAAGALILSWGLVPLLFMPLVGAITGATLQLRWGAPFLLFTVPAVMELFGRRVQWSRVRLSSAVQVFAAIQALLLLASYLTSAFGPVSLRDQHWRSFDSKALASELGPRLNAALAGHALCVVSGPTALAGALALQLPDHPLVLIDGRYDRSPWLSTELARRCGVLELQLGGVLAGGSLAGPRFPGLWWRVVPPAASSSVPAVSVSGRVAPAPSQGHA